MDLTAEEAVPDGGFYRQCVQELHRPHPDYTKIQALATLTLAETMQEVARQVAEVSHQLTLASRR